MKKDKLKFRRVRFTPMTDSQWNIILPLVDNGRKRKYKLREVFDAILKINRTGMQWRNWDNQELPWETLYYYFRKWQKDGIFAKVLAILVEKERIRQGREPKASTIAVDSQSVKKGSFVSLDSGIDGGKNINGRKRHFAVDTIGLPFVIFVSAANLNDGKVGLDLLWRLDEVSDRMELIRADHAYQGDFCYYAKCYDFTVEISQKPESKQGFIPQTGRWQVERSFAWLNFFRRLSKDYEKTVESSVAFLQCAFIDIILSRLA
jgi:putative transposase